MADDDFDLDDDIFDDEPQSAKVTIVKLWQDNPVFKIGVIVVAVIVAYISWAVFFKQDENALNVSRVNTSPDVTSIPGEGEVSPEFRDAIIAADQQRLEQAQQEGGSTLPTPIGSEASKIPTQDNINDLGEDPLESWRARNDPVEIGQSEIGANPPSTADLPPVLDSFTPPISPQNQVQPNAPQPQPQNQYNQDMAARMAEQMQVIMGTKQPQAANLITTGYPSMYESFLSEQEEADQRAAEYAQNEYGDASGYDQNDAFNEDSDDVERDVILNAGTVSYAQIINAVNSDIRGPVLAHILSGPMSGGRAIGEFQLEDEYLVLTFNRIVKDDKVYGSEAYALDADTTLTGVRTDVNRHWIRRVILPAAAEFIAGVGEAIADTNTTTVVVDGGAAVSSEDELDTGEELAKGVERGAERISDIIDEESDREVTVTIAKGTPIGLLFTESIYEGDAQ